MTRGLFGEGFWSGREESWGCKRKRKFLEWVSGELRRDWDRGGVMRERSIDEMTFFFAVAESDLIQEASRSSFVEEEEEEKERKKLLLF